MTKVINILTVTLVAAYPMSTLKSTSRANTSSHAAGNQVHSSLIPLDNKRILDQKAYDRWNTIAAPMLSADGRWVAYALVSAAGAETLVVRSTVDPTEFRVTRGVLPRDAPKLLSAQISADSRFVICAVRHGLRQDLAILSLPTGAITRIPHVIDYVTPSNAERYVVYRVKDDGVEDSAWHKGPANKSAGASMVGGTLILRDLRSESEVKLNEVGEYHFDEHAQYFAYTISSKQPTNNGVYVRRMSDGRVVTLVKGPGWYRSLTFDVAGVQLAFLATQDERGELRPRFTLYYAASPLAPATPIMLRSMLQSDLTLEADPKIEFTRAGNALTFNVLATRPAYHGSSPLADSANVEIWHWRDPGVFSFEKTRTWRPTPSPAQLYLAVYHLKERRWTQLVEDAASPRVLLGPDARFAVGVDNTPNSSIPQTTWHRRWAQDTFDTYLIDTQTGASRVLRRGIKAQERGMSPDSGAWAFSLSLTGRYLTYFESDRWWSFDLEKERLVDLTGSLLPAVSFRTIFRWDIAGWLAGDKRVLLYDQYDLWEIDPVGLVPPRNLTARVGRKENIIFTLWRGGPSTLLDGTTPLLLKAFDLDTMASGLWHARIDAHASPEELLMVDKRVELVAKAERAQQYLVTLETFSEFPDLWTGAQFDVLRRISDANPQQREYRWGSVELIEFTSDFGVPLKGLLYKPEGFSSTKKYPMIVGIYEQESHRFHNHFIPAPLRTAPSLLGWPVAVSKGYLYFVPDVKSSVPYPAQSAVASVLPAVRAVVERGFVDPTRICLNGHSFGGFETNFIVTQTELFRCALSGAGVSNLISLYGDPSNTRIPHQLESESDGEQMGLGGSPWSKPFVYIANSPLFFADRVKTPILLMHSDRDLLPNSQSVEFFFALQRHGNATWFINYPGEDHVLVKHANRLDWDRRVQQFFDHYLKDAPMPRWMQSPLAENSLTND